MRHEDLELYVMGLYEGDIAALEHELAGDEAARAVVADEARLELLLRDAAAAATFCPACNDLVRGSRCDACGAAARPGGYTVERVLVSNAHGRMYLARDVDGKQVALKELAFVQSPTASVVAAFEREVKFLRALDHPAIPRFCASFEEGTGVHARYYLAQELVVGEALDGRLEGHWFTEAEIVGIARQVLDVLVYLQGLSPMVIHRDIKPANLIVRGDGTIAVVDFGAAHVQGMTAGSTTIGTFGYMPIEQLAGEVDATTDLYALGASLLHLLTRREPWRILQGGSLDYVELNVSRQMRAFLGKLVAPNPRNRFQSAIEAREALERPASGRRRARAMLGWLPRPVMLAAAAALTVAGVGAAAVVSWWDEPSSELQRPTEAWGRAMGPQEYAAVLKRMLGFRDEMCRCPDKRCAEKVAEKMTAWSIEMARAHTGSDGLVTAEIERELSAVSEAMTKCMTRVMTGKIPFGVPVVPPIPPVPPVPPQVPGEAAETVTVTGGDRKFVHLQLVGASIHEAARTVAESCDLNVVVSGRVDRTVTDREAHLPCENAVEALLAFTDLKSSAEDDIVLIGHRTDLEFDAAARRSREWRRIVDDPLPHGRDVELELKQVALRDAIQLLARSGGVNAAIPASVEGTVTVRVDHVSWARTLAMVLRSANLGYRYREAGKVLRIAPAKEIDDELERELPYGFLEVRYRGQAEIAIDGATFNLPSHERMALTPGKHTVLLTRSNGERMRSNIVITRGATATITEN